jgi:HSP20 family protein
MTNRNNPWNTPETNWSNLTSNPFAAWNVAPFTNAPYNTAITTWANHANTTPTLNAYENTDSYVFELAAPGYTTESFEVAYNNNTLTLKANTPKSERPSNYSYREFNYSSFTREFTLPSNVDTNEANAKYNNGILTIIVPKSNNSNYRTIRIS